MSPGSEAQVSGAEPLESERPGLLAGLSASVVDCICGHACPALLTSLLELGELQRRIAWRTWWQVRSSQSPSLATLQGRFTRLPDAGRRRLQGAPEVWSVLHGAGLGGRSGDVERMAGWVDAEAVVAGSHPPSLRSVWTALGDFEVCPEPGGAGRAVRRASTLPVGPIVDMFSPAATADLVEIPGEGVGVNELEAALVGERAQRASELILACGSPWAEMIGRFVSVLLIRNDPGLNGFSSSSTRLALRRAVLRNVHHPLASTAGVADGIVHEAVHMILDHWELVQPLVLGDASPQEPALVSPWSGRELDTNTFVQACFVWCALFHFWVSALRQGVLEADAAIPIIRRRASGFLADPPLEARLEERHHVLGEGVIPAVRSLRLRVLEVLTVV